MTATDPPNQPPHVTGYGERRMADGSIYRGNLLAGVPQGAGMLQRPDGAIYQGAFDAGLPHGPGTLRLADGRVFRSVWTIGKAGKLERLEDQGAAPTPQRPDVAAPAPAESNALGAGVSADPGPAQVVKPARRPFPTGLLPLAGAALLGAAAVLGVVALLGAQPTARNTPPPVAAPSVATTETPANVAPEVAATAPQATPAPAPSAISQPATPAPDPTPSVQDRLTGYFLWLDTGGQSLGIDIAWDGPTAQITVDNTSALQGSVFQFDTYRTTGRIVDGALHFDALGRIDRSVSIPSVLTPYEAISARLQSGYDARTLDLALQPPATRLERIRLRDTRLAETATDSARFAAPLHLSAQLNGKRRLDLRLDNIRSASHGVLWADAGGAIAGLGNLSGTVALVIGARVQPAIAGKTPDQRILLIAAAAGGQTGLSLTPTDGGADQPITLSTGLISAPGDTVGHRMTGIVGVETASGSLTGEARLIEAMSLSDFAGTFAMADPQVLYTPWTMVTIDPVTAPDRITLYHQPSAYGGNVEITEPRIILLGDRIALRWQGKDHHMYFDRDLLRIDEMAPNGPTLNTRFLKRQTPAQVARFQAGLAAQEEDIGRVLARLKGNSMYFEGRATDGNRFRKTKIIMDFITLENGQLVATTEVEIEGARRARGYMGILTGWIPGSPVTPGLPQIQLLEIFGGPIDTFDRYLSMGRWQKPVPVDDILPLTLQIELSPSGEGRFRILSGKSKEFPRGLQGEGTLTMRQTPR